MTQTLKENFYTKKLTKVKQKVKLIEVKQKVKNASVNLLEVDSFDRKNLLLEEFNEKQAEEVITAISQLNKIKFGSLKQLDTAKSEAINDLKKAMKAGGEEKPQPKKGKLDTLKNLFKKTEDVPPEVNPVVLNIAFIDGLKKFFNIFTKYVNAMEGASKDKSLITILQGSTEHPINIDIVRFKDVLNKTLAKKTTKEDKEKIQNKIKSVEEIEDLIAKGLSPQDKGKNWVEKYLGGEEGLKSLSAQLLSAKLGEIETIAKSINSSFPEVPKQEEVKKQAEETKGEEGKDKEGKQLNPKEQKAQIVAIQNIAKEAGIKEEETIERFLSKIMGYNDGIKHPDADIAIQVLKDFAYNQAKVTKGQLDGFVDGLAIDQEAVKKKVGDIVAKKAEEKAKKEGPEQTHAATKGGGNRTKNKRRGR